MSKLVHAILITVFCLSLPFNAMSKDCCDKSDLVKESVIYVSMDGDFSDSVSHNNCCNDHCHHGHLDLAFTERSSFSSLIKDRKLFFSPSSLESSQNNPLNRPPRIAS